MYKEKLHKQVKILGINVDSTSVTSVLRFVRSRHEKFLIVTPNPEQIITAQNDLVFANILNSADLSLPDGIGLIAAHKFLQLPTTHNPLLKPILYFAQGLGVGFSAITDREWLTKDLKPVRGRDVFLELIKVANKKRWRVFLLGDKSGSALKAKEVLGKNYKGLSIFAALGPNLDTDANPQTATDRKIEKSSLETINKTSPHILFVGFGAPKQEKWLYRWLPKINTGGAMVVGGTFDYISGKKKTPPTWIADSGFEWLWRILIGDQKIERVSQAFPKFPLIIFWQKLNRKTPNAS
jgi:N-acetylglucosaminyldiphosphoundecaprenol N-acetyl-beta-D-mannosaminyltransferase